MITEKMYKCGKCGKRFADRDRCYIHELTCGKKDCKNCDVVVELARKLIELESRIAALESRQQIITVPSVPINPLTPNIPEKEFHWTCTSRTKEETTVPPVPLNPLAPAIPEKEVDWTCTSETKKETTAWAK